MVIFLQGRRLFSNTDSALTGVEKGAEQAEKGVCRARLGDWGIVTHIRNAISNSNSPVPSTQTLSAEILHSKAQELAICFI